MDINSLLGRSMMADIDNAITKRVREFSGEPFAKDENFAMGGELLEVGDFMFIHIWLVGPVNVHTFDACKLEFVASGKNMTMESDSTEITTLYSKKMGIGVTEFDIELDDTLRNFLLTETVSIINIAFQQKKASVSISDMTELRKLISAKAN